jgi:hypothetical protein
LLDLCSVRSRSGLPDLLGMLDLCRVRTSTGTSVLFVWSSSVQLGMLQLLGST